MPWYAINTSILIPSLRARIPEVKQVWLVDDSAGGSLMELLYNWYKLFSQEGKKFGYLINGSKSWLMVNPGSTDTRSSRRGRVDVWKGGQNYNNRRSTTPRNSHWITGIQRPMMQWKSTGLEGKHRVAGWDCKESITCRLRRLHKGLQIEKSIFYAYNWVF